MTVNIPHILRNTIGAPSFILSAMVCAFSIKCYLIYLLIPKDFKKNSHHMSWLFLLGVLLGALFGDLAWIIKLTARLMITSIPYSTTVFFIRISWAFLIIEYQSLSLFIESLTEKKYRLSLLQKCLLILSGFFTLYFLYTAFFDTNLITREARNLALNTNDISSAPLEIRMMRYTVLALLHLLVIPSLYLATKKIRTQSLPKILYHQLKMLIRFLIIPFLILEFLIAINFYTKPIQEFTYAIVSTSTMLLAFLIYYCIRQVMGLRFLNFGNHVESYHRFNFINDFKDILKKLSHVTSIQELKQVTQIFFKDCFDLPIDKTRLIIRSLNKQAQQSAMTSILSDKEQIVEQFLSTCPTDHLQNIPVITVQHDTIEADIGSPCAFLHHHGILIRDEIEFNNFYANSSIRTELLDFLSRLNADIFLPIYEKDMVVGYIIVDISARDHTLYGRAERDEMLVFASYLANIINLLQNRNLKSLIEHEQTIKEELYLKHQEINSYKESIYSFIRGAHQDIGFIFYHHKVFSLANKIAKDLIIINLNTQDTHPITIELKKIVAQVLDYKTAITSTVTNTFGQKLIIHATPNIENNSVVMALCQPEITDIIGHQLEHLSDPTTWDYILYLETTESGKLINKLIPGTGKLLLNFKIELLKTALGRKAVLLEMAEEDLLSTVQLLHHVSLREQLEVIKLTTKLEKFETAIKIFGINPIFDANKTPSLLEKLNNTGTLFIQNIHLLSLETQEHLAEFIKYGFYHLLKSDQKVFSNVRIICSTNQNLRALVQEEKFSKSLFKQLQKTSLSMPSLLSLPEQELHTLAEGFCQELSTQHAQPYLPLSAYDKKLLIKQKPVSLYELKNRIEQLITQQNKHTPVDQELVFEGVHEINDSDLIEVARMGKQALKDPDIMHKLWKKFKNQNKIAAFLDVNRSSVYRRYKKYNLG